jgi:hypothetical protein
MLCVAQGGPSVSKSGVCAFARYAQRLPRTSRAAAVHDRVAHKAQLPGGVDVGCAGHWRAHLREVTRLGRDVHGHGVYVCQIAYDLRRGFAALYAGQPRHAVSGSRLGVVQEPWLTEVAVSRPVGELVNEREVGLPVASSRQHFAERARAERSWWSHQRDFAMVECGDVERVRDVQRSLR